MGTKTVYVPTKEGILMLLEYDILKLTWERDCLREQMDSIEQRYAENDIFDDDGVFEELEGDEIELIYSINALQRRKDLITAPTIKDIPW